MWVAAYGFASPPVPRGWSAWTFWQYASGGTVAGVDSPGETDLDAFSAKAVGLINPGGQASRWLARVSVSIGSLGAMAHETLAYSATGLPPGLTFGRGLISGILRATAGATARPATYQVRLVVRNAAGRTSTVSFRWAVTAVCARYRAYRSCPGG